MQNVLTGVQQDRADPPGQAKVEPQVELFGEFELLKFVARGGVGVVYQARHRVLDRMVALKVITPGGDRLEEFVERFHNEARAAASLEHPNIVPVYGFGEVDHRYYLAMRFLEGGTLANQHAIVDSPDQLRAGVERVLKIARATHFAHQRGILHRDIKPANILLDRSGEPFLTDFGLAKVLESNVTVTQSLAVLGTPAFMSPEQASGKTREITTAADVYGLGAVLYQLLTGVPPFFGQATLEILRQVLEREPIRPSQRNPLVPPELETICLKALEKRPADRYPSAQALAEDLHRWLHGEPVRALPVSTVQRFVKWVRRKPATATLAGVALIALCSTMILSVVMNVRLTAADRRLREQVEKRRLELVRLEVAAGNRLIEQGDGGAALLPFAKAAALDENESSRMRMHRYRFALTQAQLPRLEHVLPHQGPVFSARFDPNGENVLTGAGDNHARVWTVATLGKTPTPSAVAVLTSAVVWAEFTLEPGWIALRGKAGHAHWWNWPHQRLENSLPVNRSRGAREAISTALMTLPDPPRMVLVGATNVSLTPRVHEPASESTWNFPGRVNATLSSPDQKSLLVLLDGGVFVVRVDPPNQPRALVAGRNWRNGAWSPDGKRILLADDRFGAQLFDAKTGEPLSPNLLHGDMVLGCRYAPDGLSFATFCFDNTIHLFDADRGRPLAAPLRHRAPVRAVAYRPDGRVLASASQDRTVRRWDAQTGESIGSPLHHNDAVLDVQFSPDGRRLLTASADGQARIWSLASEGLPNRSWDHAAPTETALFSRDGRFVAAVGLSRELRIWDVATGEPAGPALLHPDRVLEFSWLDENTLLTCCADDQFRWWHRSGGILASNRPMSSEIKGRYSGRFRPGSSDFLVQKRRQRPWVWDPARGQVRIRLSEAPAEGYSEYSPGGRWIVTTHDRQLWVSDAESGKAHAAPVRLDQRAEFAAVSEDGTHAAVASADFSISLWEVKTSNRTAVLRRHTATLRHLQFSPDGAILATASDDQSLCLWDVATGEPLGPPLRHGNRVLRVDPRRDSRAFATACSDGFARVWEATDESPSVEEMLRRAGQWQGE